MILNEKTFKELSSFISEVNNGDTLEKKRKRANTDGRKMLSNIMKTHEKMKLQDISELIYKKRNANAEIIYNIKKHQDFMDSDYFYREKYFQVYEFYKEMVKKLDWRPFRNSIINSIKMQGA